MPPETYEQIHYVTPQTYPQLKKFLKEGETFITDEQLKSRKKKLFLNKVFFKRLCALVDRIHVFEEQFEEAELKAKKEKKLKDDERRKEGRRRAKEKLNASKDRRLKLQKNESKMSPKL